MAATSAIIPFAAVYHRAAGEVVERGNHRADSTLDVVLFDRDGTVVVDVPYNGEPARVVPMPGARAALDELRTAGIAVGVVSNQSGIARGLFDAAAVDAVNARIESLLGPFAGWWYCPHDDRDRCDCRKPKPGLVLRALCELGFRPERCALIGDTGADIDAARTAGLRSVLVPNDATRREEIAAAPTVAPNLAAAVQRLMGAS
jgi:HAD superfamily hydrolase (TIGR01662 family)